MERRATLIQSSTVVPVSDDIAEWLCRVALSHLRVPSARYQLAQAQARTAILPALL